MSPTGRASILMCIMLATAFAGCAKDPAPAGDPPPSSPVFIPPVSGARLDFGESFEGGFDVWTKRAEFLDENRDVNTESFARPTTTNSSEGAQSLELGLAATRYGGSVWVVRTVELTPGAAYDVIAEADVLNGEPGALVDHLFYVGLVAPKDGLSFSPENAGGDHMAVRMRLGGDRVWEKADLQWATPIPASGKVYIAVGASGVSEQGIHVFVDNMTIGFYPK